MSNIVGQSYTQKFISPILAVVSDDGFDRERRVVADGRDLDEHRVFAGFFEIYFYGHRTTHAVVTSRSNDVVVFACVVDSKGEIIDLGDISWVSSDIDGERLTY